MRVYYIWHRKNRSDNLLIYNHMFLRVENNNVFNTDSVFNAHMYIGNFQNLQLLLYTRFPEKENEGWKIWSIRLAQFHFKITLERSTSRNCMSEHLANDQIVLWRLPYLHQPDEKMQIRRSYISCLLLLGADILTSMRLSQPSQLQFKPDKFSSNSSPRLRHTLRCIFWILR